MIRISKPEIKAKKSGPAAKYNPNTTSDYELHISQEGTIQFLSESSERMRIPLEIGVTIINEVTPGSRFNICCVVAKVCDAIKNAHCCFSLSLSHTRA